MSPIRWHKKNRWAFFSMQGGALFAFEFGILSSNEYAVQALLRNKRPVHIYDFARSDLWVTTHAPTTNVVARASGMIPPDSPPRSICEIHDALKANLSPARYEGIIGVLRGYATGVYSRCFVLTMLTTLLSGQPSAQRHLETSFGRPTIP